MREGGQTSGFSWRRHDLLRVAPHVWASVLVHYPSLADLPLVQSWADRGWPVIVRRSVETEDPGLVPIGLPLPLRSASTASLSFFRSRASCNAPLRPCCG